VTSGTTGATEETGIPHLAKQITAVTTLLAVSEDKAMFEELLRRRFPRPGEQVPLIVTRASKNSDARE
jgi:hypothetical protein